MNAKKVNITANALSEIIQVAFMPIHNVKGIFLAYSTHALHKLA